VDWDLVMKVLIVLEDAHVFYVSTFGEAEYLRGFAGI
jgi:hypothetical protein